ncbi:MFS transporter [Mucilaginibacter sp. UYCu711]|uniref:MFS transporter n=1 Tax=Mucilaginibacter sp. UYCu711 TaxID=3156339 RepID=UPI003D1C77A2
MKLKKLTAELADPFRSLKNSIFARLYFAETISLIGDAFTWVGLALLAYQFDEERSAVILATALTLRVSAFIVFSPFAGILADKIDRKKILYITHFFRMAVVAYLPFIKAEWQIYVLVFLLNVFNAFFTPTYRSVISQIVEKGIYRQAVGLSTATNQLFGVLGPGLAGIMAVWFGARQIFFVDAASFVIAGLLILTLPGSLMRKPAAGEAIKEKPSTGQDLLKGVRLLFGNKLIRFALSIEFVSAIAGAQILVNTVGYIRSGLHQNNQHYGWVMAAFGIGAATAAFVSGAIDKSKSRKASLLIGALMLGLAITGANYVNYGLLLLLWAIAGLGQSLAEIPSETLIGENIAAEEQGKVYGTHFAFSHLWWAIAYPIAGFLGNRLPANNFLYGGILTLLFLLLIFAFLNPLKIKSPVSG